MDQDVFRNRNTIAQLILTDEPDVLDEDGRICHELAGLAQRHARRGIQPQLALEQAGTLFSGLELKDMHTARGLVRISHFRVEFIVGASDSDRTGIAPFYFRRQVAGDNLPFDTAISGGLQNLVRNLAGIRGSAKRSYDALLAEVGKPAFDADHHLHSLEGRLLYT